MHARCCRRHEIPPDHAWSICDCKNQVHTYHMFMKSHTQVCKCTQVYHRFVKFALHQQLASLSPMGCEGIFIVSPMGCKGMHPQHHRLLCLMYARTPHAWPQKVMALFLLRKKTRALAYASYVVPIQGTTITSYLFKALQAFRHHKHNHSKGITSVQGTTITAYLWCLNACCALNMYLITAP